MSTTSGPKLTDSRVQSVGPGDYTDPATQGLQLRVRKKGKKPNESLTRTWLFRYTWRRTWVRMTIGHYPGTKLAAARNIAKDLREKIGQGIDPRRARPKRSALAGPASAEDEHTIEHLVSEFVERHLRPNRKRPEYAEGILEREVLPLWRGRDARTITPREVIDLLDGIVDRGSTVMANRTAALLTQLFKFGIHRHVVEASPVQLLYRPGGKEEPRRRALSDDELRIFLLNLDTVCRSARIAAALRILLLTGQRRGELAAAKWANVDLKAKTWTIPDEDSKWRGHTVPLTGWAVSEFKTLKRLAGRSAFVMPASDGSKAAAATLITRSVARCRKTWKKHGIAPFTPHDLRRSCRTGLAKLKIPTHIAERVINHAPEKIEGTYDVHDYAAEKRAALEQWEAHLRGVTK